MLLFISLAGMGRTGSYKNFTASDSGLVKDTLFNSKDNSKDSLIIDTTLTIIKTDTLSEGKKLFEGRCQKCHSLYSPKEFTAAEWKDNLDAMKDNAKLTRSEYNLIFHYLSKNAKLK